ncbi:MAG: RNA polymerase-binding protein DksA [Steroidobacteraceae bacterium]|jgi:DnaK suppressor protein
MAGKKPGTRHSKSKKAAAPKARGRRPQLRRTAALSSRTLAAAPARPAARAAIKASPAAAKGESQTARRNAPAAEPPASHHALVPGGATAAQAISATSRLRTAVPAAADGDDSEVTESLLAGPRNVKPYVAKRGEQYMGKAQLEHFRQILLSWKRDLMVEVDRTVSHMKDEAANFPDPNDRATQEEEFSLELRTRDRERKLIRKIEEALKRIEDGTYGHCLETGEEIGIKRLEARPVATLTIEAQERRERRERQYGDRDDRYR